MANDTSLPFEIGIEKAKSDLSKAIIDIGKKYTIPSSIMTLILQEVISDSKLNTYGTILAYYDIANPTQENQDILQNDDVEMKEENTD